MPYVVDENGVPIISREEIELKAEEIISLFSPDARSTPQMTPVGTIAAKLNQEYGIEFDFESDLGESKNGRKILGKFRFQPRAIFVDKSLDFNQGKWLFTLAHELGHLVFHRNLVIPEKVHAKWKSDGVVIDSEDDITPTDSTPSSFTEWTEWQANKFAASLLMPRISFTNYVAIEIAKLGLVRNPGRIYLDNQPGNLRSLDQVLAPVCGLFQVSREAATIRMKEFGFIMDMRQSNVRRIRELLREE